MRQITLFCVLLGSLSANPKDLTVVAGEAFCLDDGKFLEIKVSDRAVLDWGSFSIGAGQTTKFIQPSAASAVLNRVTGGSESLINGLLLSNGIVYLINNQGIVIGPEGRVDVAAFVASTLDMDADHFLRNEPIWVGEGGIGSITHLGVIEAKSGGVTLLAHRIESRGETRALEGKVHFLAGHEILVQPNGEADWFIRPEMPGGGLEHTGKIQALEVKLLADGPIPLSIGKGGMIEANSVVREGGRVFLRAEGNLRQQGNINVSGSTGGVVEIAGADVYHEGTILADGGGRVTIAASGAYLEPQSSYISALGGKIEVVAEKGLLTSGVHAGEVSLQMKTPFSFGNSLQVPLLNGNVLIADEQQLYLFDESRTQFLAATDRRDVHTADWMFSAMHEAMPVLTITAANDLLLNADITNVGSNITISAGNDLTLTGCLVKNTNGNILALAGVDMIGDATSGFKTTDATSTITLVADNNFPSSPSIGPGIFNFDPNTTICTNNCLATGGFVQLYTAQTNPSVYPLFINNAVAPDAALQTLLTYYPNGTEGVPYHIYYKGAVPVPVLPRMAVVVSQLGVAVTEPLNASTDTTESSVQQNSSTPDPRKTCRIPSVSVRVGG